MAENIAALLTVASTPKTISKVGVATKATPNPNTTESSWFGYYRLAGSISIPESFTIALVATTNYSKIGATLDTVLASATAPEIDDIYTDPAPTSDIIIAQINGKRFTVIGNYIGGLSDAGIQWTLSVSNMSTVISWPQLATNTFQQLTWMYGSYQIAAMATSVTVAYI